MKTTKTTLDYLHLSDVMPFQSIPSFYTVDERFAETFRMEVVDEHRYPPD